MKKISIFSIFLFCATIFSLPAQSISDNIDISSSANGVVALPSTAPAAYINAGFVKYTKIQAPNGQAIHFVAQNAITEAQIVRARNILQFYLTNVPGTQYGADKTAVINAMGNNEAVLMLLNGSDTGNPPNLPAQTLYQNEIAVEGHQWYINNEYDQHRDASFEEILHLMHDTGIGVDNNGTPNPNGALPAYQTEIRAAQQNALTNNLWGIGASDWINELTQENSLSQEYLAAVVDSYYGLWGPWTGSTTHGMWGLYVSKTRAEIQTEDPMGYALMPKYFSPYINVNMDIDPTFNGSFTMTFDAAQPYTYKSQYLQHVTLTGTNASNIKGNDQYNRLNGNSGNNTLEGVKGNDRLDGKEGTDIAKFTGNQSEYTVTIQGAFTIITDNTNDRDGVDTLLNIETIRYADGDVSIVTSTQNIAADKIFKVYPNPASDVLIVEFHDITDLFRVSNLELYDQAGRKIAIRELAIDAHQTEINIKHFPPGIYLIKIFGEKGYAAQQVVIE